MGGGRDALALALFASEQVSFAPEQVSFASEKVSFASGTGSFSSPVRRPSKVGLAAPFAFPGLAPPPSPLRGPFAYSRFRRTGVDSLLLNAAFRRIHAAHPGIAPALSESGWRSHPRCTIDDFLGFFLCCLLFVVCCLLFVFSAVLQTGGRAAFAAPSAEGRPGRAARMRRERGMSHGGRIRAVRQA
ncbi:hypothetical protein JOJ88_000275 [Pantoea cypripedii]|nr:hypothetical protein [Pantoea cypripedii]